MRSGIRDPSEKDSVRNQGRIQSMAVSVFDWDALLSAFTWYHGGNVDAYLTYAMTSGDQLMDAKKPSQCFVVSRKDCCKLIYPRAIDDKVGLGRTNSLDSRCLFHLLNHFPKWVWISPQVLYFFASKLILVMLSDENWRRFSFTIVFGFRLVLLSII